MALKGTLVITIGTDAQTDTDLLQKYADSPSNEPSMGLTKLASLLERIAGGSEPAVVRVGVEDGDTGAGIFSDASVSVLRTYQRGV